MPLQFFAALFHLQQEPWPPQQIGEARALALVDAVLQRSPCFQDAPMAECLHETIAEDLRLALLIPLEVSANVANELGELGSLRIHQQVRDQSKDSESIP